MHCRHGVPELHPCVPHICRHGVPGLPWRAASVRAAPGLGSVSVLPHPGTHPWTGSHLACTHRWHHPPGTITASTACIFHMPSPSPPAVLARLVDTCGATYPESPSAGVRRCWQEASTPRHKLIVDLGGATLATLPTEDGGASPSSKSPYTCGASPSSDDAAHHGEEGRLWGQGMWWGI